MKTFVAALVTAGAAVAAGPAPAQSGYPTSFAPYRYSEPAPAYHAHDANCADGSCPTGGLVPSYGRDACADGSCGCRPGESSEGSCGPDCEHGACGPECDPGVAHDHVAGIGHGHAACEDGRCDHVARRPQVGHTCSGEGCDHSSAGTTTQNPRPTYRVGGVPRRPSSTSAVRPMTTRPTARYAPDGSFRPAMNGGFQADRPLGQRPRTLYSPRPAREMQPQRPASLGGGPFEDGFTNESRPW